MNRKNDICPKCKRGRLKIMGKTRRGAVIYLCSGCGQEIVEGVR